jgi:hypothetical protein
LEGSLELEAVRRHLGRTGVYGVGQEELVKIVRLAPRPKNPELVGAAMLAGRANAALAPPWTMIKSYAV